MKRGIIETTISLSGKPRQIRCELATPDEVRAVANWNTTQPNSAAMVDAIEYAGLTCKRWNFYLAEGRAVTDAKQLRDPTILASEELAFLTIARVPRAEPSVLGLCLFRRTWANNLIVDFLALHPECLAGGTIPVKGLGAALMYAVTEIAEVLNCGAIWGEATSGSTANYQRMFRDPTITDLFFIPRDECRIFRASFATTHPIRPLHKLPLPLKSTP